MSPFAVTIKQLVTHYKRVLKRHLSASNYSKKVEDLQIKRLTLKQASDIDLYHITSRVLYDTESWLASQHISANEHSGLNEFRDHLKEVMKNYYVENNQVMNSQQNASRVIVESIQLLNMPFNETISLQLKKNIRLLHKLKSKEALSALRSALHKLSTAKKTDLTQILRFIENEQQSLAH